MNFTADNWIALLPILITSATAVVVMLSIAARRQHGFNAAVCVVGLNAALLSCLGAIQVIPQKVTPLLIVDGFSVFYMALILVMTLVTATLCYAYFEGYKGNREEIYLLLTLSALGALTLVCSRNFVSFFIGLELLSVPLYGMIAYPHDNRKSLEGAIKYIVLSAIASAFILFGMALIYARTGTLAFGTLGYRLVSADFGHDVLLLTGGALMLVGIGFKISVVPFHLWTPDVYEGAPAPIAGFLATASKTAIFALLLRYFVESQAYHSQTLLNILSVIALLSIVVGNILALMQDNLKRLLAYSSIAHFGYILVAFVVAGRFAVEAVGVYLITYIVTTLGAFGVISLMSSPMRDDDAVNLFDYRGLFWRNPYLAAILTGMLLSLAGIPMTAGFIGKFYVFAVGVNSRLWILLGAVIFGSAVGLYYYLRATITLYLRPRWIQPFMAEEHWGLRAGGLVVLGITVLMFFLGLYPDPVINLIKEAGLATMHGQSLTYLLH